MMQHFTSRLHASKLSCERFPPPSRTVTSPAFVQHFCISTHAITQQPRLSSSTAQQHNIGSSAPPQQYAVAPPWAHSSRAWSAQPLHNLNQHSQYHPALVTISPIGEQQHNGLLSTEALGFEPHTLQITLESLCEALHLNHHTVVGIVEQRPGILLTPDQPIIVLYQLATLLDVSPLRVANLLGTKYAHVLALVPQHLEQRCMDLCAVMGWRSDCLQATAHIIGPEAFIHLVSSDPSQVCQQLATMAVALDCETVPAAVAAVVQHYPLLLDRRDYLIWPQIKLLADTAGVTPRQLLSELDPQQCKGLAAVLLYEPGWIAAQLRSLAAVLEQNRAVCGRQLVWLMCRLATPDKLDLAKRRMEALLKLSDAHQPWRDELQQADDRGLSVLLTASNASMQHLQFLCDTGRENMCGMTMLEVVGCEEREFQQRYGSAYDEWIELQTE